MQRVASSLRTALLFAMLVAMPIADRTAHAQVDPRGPVRTIPTAHFRVHYRADSGHASEVLARKAAAFAEQSYAQLSRELVAPRGVIDLLLADNVDYSNGFAQVFPSNRIVVYAVPPISSIELRFHDDWLQLVIAHELAHIFHIDRARGLWSVGRSLFGRNPLFFPNAFTPSWVKEGLAVHYESKLTGSGRVYAAESRAVANAAALAGQVPPISRWSLATSRFPRGTTAYAYGTLLMHQATLVGGDSAMRRFVDATALHPIPFRLNRASRGAFGMSFDSLLTRVPLALPAIPEDAAWRLVSSDGWFASSPRWLNADSLIWTASNGRDVAGVFVARVGVANRARSENPDEAGEAAPAAPRRIARRNALDVNVPMGAGADSVLFAQTDLSDPYVVRSDLHVGRGEHERRVTWNARLTHPDARHDGAIVAVQLDAAHTRVVRVSATGEVISLPNLSATGSWAEPRWSADGSRIAAVQLLPTGEERVVVLDSSGALQQVVSGARAVFASPSWTPDGTRLVWASNRSGRMQLETARVASASAVADTGRWRDAGTGAGAGAGREVRQASRVRTGVYEPSVSPDGKSVVALYFREDGYHVAVAPLDTAGALVEALVGNAVNPVSVAAPTAVSDSATDAASARYSPLRQLLPRYWLPVIGEGRLGHSTLGVSSSSVDILGRHAWAANAAVNPSLREWDGGAAYRYAGLGVPVLDLSASQSWDATFLVVDSARAPLGEIARRRRFATMSSTFSRPRVRWSVSGTVGAQYEWRDFTATSDPLLGAPNSLLRRGARYPSLFANSSWNTLRRGALAIAHEEGVSVSSSTSYRWRQDAPSLTGSWRSVISGRGYLPLDLPGYSRHVLSLRAALGWADTKTATEFSVGGVSGVSAEVLPGVSIGDPARTFAVRGVVSGAQRGIRALGGGVDYRVPLVILKQGPSPLGFFADRLSMTFFTDAGRAWCPGALASQSASVGLCERPGVRDGWIASAGAEVVFDVALQYDAPYRVRLGSAIPYVAPAGVSRRGAVYVSLGSFF